MQLELKSSKFIFIYLFKYKSLPSSLFYLTNPSDFTIHSSTIRSLELLDFFLFKTLNFSVASSCFFYLHRIRHLFSCLDDASQDFCSLSCFLSLTLTTAIFYTIIFLKLHLFLLLKFSTFLLV